MRKLLLVSAACWLGIVAPASARDILVLGGNPPGSLFYAQAQGLAAVITKHSDVKVDVFPQGATFWYPMLGTREVDFGIVSPIDAYLAYRGMPPYEKSTDGAGFGMRTIMLGLSNNLSIIVAKDANIDTFEDLRGRHVVTNYGAFVAASMTAVAALAAAGMSEDDVRVVMVGGYPQGVRAVIEGRAVGAVGSLGSAVIRELDSARGAKYLSIPSTPEAVARVKTLAPGFDLVRMSPGPPGIEGETTMLEYTVTLISRVDLEPASVQTILRALHENYQELGTIHPTLRRWTPDRFVSRAAVIPYHPAAIDYYRDVGLWSTEMDARQQMLLMQEQARIAESVPQGSGCADEERNPRCVRK
jgi:TRAP transporter TAXI family solute receptor